MKKASSRDRYLVASIPFQSLIVWAILSGIFFPNFLEVKGSDGAGFLFLLAVTIAMSLLFYRKPVKRVLL